ncbi:sigma-70 family RNA polymerase sigma factor [Kamptonema cortianum]|nr:sigma-70 family RNA polymerase sigma factor [Kamptonema cortianum]
MVEASDIQEPETEPVDHELVARARKGDKAAYEVLVKRHYQKVYHQAMSILRNETDALDLSQEVFVKAWLALARFEGKSAFTTWLYRITHNLGIDHIRKNRRHVEVDFDEVIPTEESDAPTESRLVEPARQSEAMERGELRARIDAGLAQLSPEHREALVLREFEELDYREIAKVQGCSVGTVMSRLFYARKNLKKFLKEQ